MEKLRIQDSIEKKTLDLGF